MDKHKRSSKEIGELIIGQGDPKQIQLIESEPLSAKEILTKAREAIEGKGAINQFEEEGNMTESKKKGKKANKDGKTKEYRERIKKEIVKKSSDGDLSIENVVKEEDFKERTGRDDLINEEVKEEIFADNMFDADKRLDIMQKLGKKNAGLLDKFVSWLKPVMDKFTRYFNSPKYGLKREQMNQMYDELGKALRQIKVDGKTRYRYGNTTHVMQYADGKELPTVYSFAGEKALTANQKALAKARQMENEGKSREEIFNTTGWVKGKDNKWRFEIPDNLDEIDYSSIERIGNSVKLVEMYNNPALYKAYPFLKKIKVSNKDLGENVAGRTRGGKTYTFLEFLGSKLFGNNEKSKMQMEIELNLEALGGDGDVDEAGKTLIHEIQHIIQVYEDFARGGSNKEKDYKKLAGEQEARETEQRAYNNTNSLRAYDLEESFTENYEVPIIHTEDAVIVFGGEKYSMISQKAIDNSEKLNDNAHKVTREYTDILQRSLEFVKTIVENKNFKVNSSDDVDTLCDKILSSVKNAVERQFHLYERATNLEEKQRHLNLGAFYLGMVDEIRSDLNAGGQTYKAVVGSRVVRESAGAGSNLAKSIQARGRQISNDEKIAIKSAASTNGFSEDIKGIVNDVRKQNRGDGIKYSFQKAYDKLAKALHKLNQAFEDLNKDDLEDLSELLDIQKLK